MSKHKIELDPFVARQIEKAASIIKDGGIILYPTDTIWGIGCDATNSSAVEKVYSLKQRADSKALVTLVGNMTMLARYVKEIPSVAIDLIEVNTSPMTIIYPSAIGLANNVVADDGSAAIRIPMSEFCCQLCLKCNVPIVSTSANISGEKAPVNFKQIAKEIKDGVDYIVAPSVEDKSATRKSSQIIKVGLDSTIEIIRK